MGTCTCMNSELVQYCLKANYNISIIITNNVGRPEN